MPERPIADDLGRGSRPPRGDLRGGHPRLGELTRDAPRPRPDARRRPRRRRPDAGHPRRRPVEGDALDELRDAREAHRRHALGELKTRFMQSMALMRWRRLQGRRRLESMASTRKDGIDSKGWRRLQRRRRLVGMASTPTAASRRYGIDSKVWRRLERMAANRLEGVALTPRAASTQTGSRPRRRARRARGVSSEMGVGEQCDGCW